MSNERRTHEFTPQVDDDQSTPARLQRLLDAELIPVDAVMDVEWHYTLGDEPRFTLTIKEKP